jgi:hypothetical protein
MFSIGDSVARANGMYLKRNRSSAPSHWVSTVAFDYERHSTPLLEISFF